ncbi:MAG: ATP-binding protein [Nitrospirae bacterium]|uniref:AAA family ATPase n=1 Tax=Candidatus Magnetobacterium casense TaxID=1455061 RepID=UPI00138E48B3|nr:ATP-binding protein [Candidatus Magnetobacterium casensis]MBF0338487.1 ATP-binding protein [Nitrospirota bacterium]
MVAADIEELPDNRIQTDDPEWHLLKSAVIYGANASGKSNLIHAMSYMKYFVLTPFNKIPDKKHISISRFNFNLKNKREPAHFEICFILDGVRYRYGFDVDDSKIHKEWLYSYPKDREKNLYIRDDNSIKIKSFKEGKKLEGKIRQNILFLSLVAQFNENTLGNNILKWFSHFNIISAMSDITILPYTLRQLSDEKFKEILLSILELADIQIKDIKRDEDYLKKTMDSVSKENQDNNLNPIVYELTTFTSHRMYNEENEEIGLIEVPLVAESEGTKKILSLAGPIAYTLLNGGMLVIDEMDARLHPNLTSYLIELFNSNKKNSQLIITTHDTNLLSNKLYRRDQVWFTEKDRDGSTDLYSLVEFKLKGNEPYERDYILGKYGAIPFICSDISSLIE